MWSSMYNPNGDYETPDTFTDGTLFDATDRSSDDSWPFTASDYYYLRRCATHFLLSSTLKRSSRLTTTLQLL
jgi:hypothetical protein